MQKPMPLEYHPRRYELSNELHARPFPTLEAPCHCAFLAIKEPSGAAERDRDRDTAHLIDLLDRYGTPHPPPGANHFYGDLGRSQLKWERHTEFVTYSLFRKGVADSPFSGRIPEMFPQDWISQGPGKILTAAMVRVVPFADEAEESRLIAGPVSDWFVPESLALSRVVDGQATIASDFRIDEGGNIRMAVLARNGIGPRRLGRIVQRLLEIETYKSMAMLTLPVARQVSARTAELDLELSALVQEMASGKGTPDTMLDQLLQMSAEIEALSSASAFRFGAAGAYEAIVNQRIEVLREERVQGRQTLQEFMARRFDPAMRTCRSAEQRLEDLSERAARASNLLRTRIDVGMAAQNQELLASMNKRAELQLRLQETVEGLSIVAISYYAVSLLSYFVSPLAKSLFGLSKEWSVALLVIPVVLFVGWMTRRIRKRLEH